jgi:hypothetical protein
VVREQINNHCIHGGNHMIATGNRKMIVSDCGNHSGDHVIAVIMIA